MNITFLGTGAADWSQDMRGTKGYRRCSSVLIDKKLLIDPGPHIFDYEEDFHLSSLYANVDNILLTHSHGDHLSVDNLAKLCKEKERMLYCEAHAEKSVAQIPGLHSHVLVPYVPMHIGDYTVSALQANHGTDIPDEIPLHFIIEKDNKRIFYGCDGAWLLRKAWYYLREYTFDLMVLDGTLGDADGDARIFEHNSLVMVEQIVKTLRASGVMKPQGSIIISHLAHETHGTQQQVEERLKAAQIGVAYDGYTISV